MNSTQGSVLAMRSTLLADVLEVSIAPPTSELAHQDLHRLEQSWNMIGCFPFVEH